jgi:outer membrane protein assembly complex protein YaeT
VAFFIPATSLARQIDSICISGNSNFSEDSIKAKILIKSGDVFKEDEVNKAIKRLHTTGWFERVSMNFDKGVLYCQVKELPRVLDVKYVGNSLISDSVLEKCCMISKGALASPYFIWRDVETINTLYRSMGRAAIRVEVEQKEVSPSRINLEFKIKEGPRIFIKDLQFFGNAALSERLLVANMLTKPSPFYRILGHNACYNTEAFAIDESIIRKLYTSRGFLSCKVAAVNAEVSQNFKAISLKMVIDEGEQYYLEELQIKNQTKLVPTKLASKYVRGKLGLKRGICDLQKIKKVEQSLAKHLLSLGYRDVDVSYEILATGHNRVALSFLLIDKAPILIKEIKITGNKKTTSELIRNQLYLEEGQSYNELEKDKSIAQLKSLQLFKEVALEPKIDEESKSATILVKVTEDKTVHVGAHLGVDTINGSGASLKFSAKNLFGKNYKITSEAGLKTKKQNVGAEFVAGLNKNSSLSAFALYKDSSAVQKHQEDAKAKKKLAESTMEKIAQGQTPQSKDKMSAKFGFGLTNRLLSNVKHEIEASFIYQKAGEDPVKEIQPITSGRIRELTTGSFKYGKLKNSLLWAFTEHNDQKHLIFKSSCSHSYYRDIGCDYSLHKFRATLKSRLPIRPLEELYLVVKADAGIITQFGKQTTLRHQSCFHLGGEDSLRGFEKYGCDPHVRNLGRHLALGGDRYYRAVGELHTNLGMPDSIPVSFFGFLDIGNIWRSNIEGCDKLIGNENKIRVSAGVGVTLPVGNGRIKLTKALFTRAHEGDAKDALNVDLSVDF